jgi:hypothetical protein
MQSAIGIQQLNDRLTMLIDRDVLNGRETRERAKLGTGDGEKEQMSKLVSDSEPKMDCFSGRLWACRRGSVVHPLPADHRVAMGCGCANKRDSAEINHDIRLSHRNFFLPSTSSADVQLYS